LGPRDVLLFGAAHRFVCHHDLFRAARRFRFVGAAFWGHAMFCFVATAFWGRTSPLFVIAAFLEPRDDSILLTRPFEAARCLVFPAVALRGLASLSSVGVAISGPCDILFYRSGLSGPCADFLSSQPFWAARYLHFESAAVGAVWQFCFVTEVSLVATRLFCLW